MRSYLTADIVCPHEIKAVSPGERADTIALGLGSSEASK
jgi:hypothetical protein